MIKVGPTSPGCFRHLPPGNSTGAGASRSLCSGGRGLQCIPVEEVHRFQFVRHHSKASAALAPVTYQRLPDRCIRRPTICRPAPSTIPDTICVPCWRYLSYCNCVCVSLAAKWSTHLAAASCLWGCGVNLTTAASTLPAFSSCLGLLQLLLYVPPCPDRVFEDPTMSPPAGLPLVSLPWPFSGSPVSG